MARRLRQEAGAELSPSQTAALATIEKHGPLTPSELANRERVQRPTVTRVMGRLEEAGLIARAADPDRPALLAGEHLPRRPRAARRRRAPARTPTSPSASTRSTPTTARRWTAPPRSSSACSRRTASGERRPVSAPSSHLEVPNYRRYFAGQVISISGNWMQIVAEMWLIVQLTGSGVAVGLTAALQFLPMLLFGACGGLLADRVTKRRLLMITQTADGASPR